MEKLNLFTLLIVVIFIVVTPTDLDIELLLLLITYLFLTYYNITYTNRNKFFYIFSRNNAYIPSDTLEFSSTLALSTIFPIMAIVFSFGLLTVITAYDLKEFTNSNYFIVFSLFVSIILNVYFFKFLKLITCPSKKQISKEDLL